MPETEIDPKLALRWRARIRRAFGVPDLLTDAHALRFIGNEFANKYNRDCIGHRAVPAIVDALVAQGATGSLDHCLIGDDAGQIFVGSVQKEELCREIARNVTSRFADVGISSEIARELYREVATEIITRTAAHVGALPFEAPSAGYFRADVEHPTQPFAFES